MLGVQKVSGSNLQLKGLKYQLVVKPDGTLPGKAPGHSEQTVPPMPQQCPAVLCIISWLLGMLVAQEERIVPSNAQHLQLKLL